MNSTNSKNSSARYSILFDLTRCIGCETCVIACKMEHDLPVGENWMRVEVIGDPGKNVENVKYPDLEMSFRPVTCMHCQNPTCVDACPDGAIVRREDGVVLMDREKCTGCELCLPACPYDVIHFDKRSKLAGKCDFCSSRIGQGLEPFCARECPVGAIRFVDSVKASGHAHGGEKGCALLPEKGTRPSHRYVE